MIVRRSTRGHQKAFTLIEVMVALVIVALSVAAAQMASSSSARRLTYLRTKTYGHWVAENQMNRLLSGQSGYQLQPGQQRGTVMQAGQEWSWQADILADKEQQLNITLVVQQQSASGNSEQVKMTVRQHEY